MPPSRALAERLLSQTLCRSCRQNVQLAGFNAPSSSHYFSTDVSKFAPQGGGKQTMSDLAAILSKDKPERQGAVGLAGNDDSSWDPLTMRSIFGAEMDKPRKEEKPVSAARERLARTYRLHIYSHKHNTHFTLTKPNGNPLYSISTGNIGFRKSNRGTFDAAYQLASIGFRQVQERGMLRTIQDDKGVVEVVLRGFGVGREAMVKAILGQEGGAFRDYVSRVTDGTKLKFGGTRSEKPRRLG